MTKETAAGEARQRSADLAMSGITTVLVSGLLTISWRVYTAGKVPFWSAWPGILGVAVVGAGFIMMAIGYGLDPDRDGRS